MKEDVRSHTPSSLSTSLVGDVLHRLSGMRGLRRFDAGATMIGPSLTVRTRPGDNLAILAAIRIAKPGDVLVVDGSADESVAVAGEILMLFALSRGVRGIVLDGVIRDAQAIRRQSEFGCFAKGVSLRGPTKTGPGEINCPVSVGGQCVYPGDIVIGDCDGVIAVPFADYDRVVSAAVERHALEEGMRRAILQGAQEPLPIDAMLAEAPGKIVIHE